jgi:hypothetical protein
LLVGESAGVMLSFLAPKTLGLTIVVSYG